MQSLKSKWEESEAKGTKNMHEVDIFINVK